MTKISTNVFVVVIIQTLLKWDRQKTVSKESERDLRDRRK